MSDGEIEYKRLALHEEETGTTEKAMPDYGATEVSAHPDNYIQSALIAVFICCPFGITALIYSLAVNRRFRQGNVEGARKASEQARSSSHLGIGVGIIMWGAVLTVVGCVVLFVLIFCFDRYRYYGYI